MELFENLIVQILASYLLIIMTKRFKWLFDHIVVFKARIFVGSRAHTSKNIIYAR